MNTQDALKIVEQMARDIEVIPHLLNPSTTLIFHKNDVEMRRLKSVPFNVHIPAVETYGLFPLVSTIEHRLVTLQDFLKGIGRLFDYKALLPKEDDDPAILEVGVTFPGYPRIA